MYNAKKEIELAIKKEKPNWDGKSFDYGVACYKNALECYEALENKIDPGHSGFSWSITKRIIKKLLDEEALTPITEKDFEYEKYLKKYQCNRCGHIWWDKENNIITDNERVVFYDETFKIPGSTWHTKAADKIIDDMFPIKFPYMPTSQPYKVYGYTFIMDKKGKVSFERGTYTHSLFYKIITPKNDVIDILKIFGDKEIVNEKEKKSIYKNVKKMIIKARKFYEENK